MGLIGDIQEARQFWSKASWTLRIVILVATFLTFSSVASLSDVVFSWKGFILDGLTFYREWVIGPIRGFAERFGLVWTSNTADFITLLALYLSAFIRLTWFTSRRIVSIVTTVIILGLFVFYAIYFSGIDSDASPQGLVICIIEIFIIPFLFRFKTKDKVVYYTPIAVAVFFVLILAAINAGISRPLV